MQRAAALSMGLKKHFCVVLVVLCAEKHRGTDLRLQPVTVCVLFFFKFTVTNVIKASGE